MNLNAMMIPLFVGLCSSAVGCGAGAGEASSSTSSALGAALTGTYDFVLEASDVAAKLRARCEAEGAGDQARAAACWDEVRSDAATEKIRFSVNERGEPIFTSFALAEGAEEVFLELPLALSEEKGTIVGKSAGWPPRGTLASRLAHVRSEMRIERSPDGTIVLLDPDKGRLAYRRTGG